MTDELGDLELVADEPQEERDAQLRELIQGLKRLALVGASNSQLKASNRVMTFLQEQGVEVVPVSRRGEAEICGATAHASLLEVEGDVDLVDVFCLPGQAADVARDAIAAGVPAIWFQDGIVNEEAIELCREAGMEVVADRCLMREYRVLVLGQERNTWFPV